MSHPYPIETPFGPAEITPTGGGHFHLDANSSGRAGLTVNGVEYGVSVHLQEGDALGLDGERVSTLNVDHLYAHRRWEIAGSYNAGEATPAARRKLMVELIRVARMWIAQHPGEVIKADYDRWQTRVAAAEVHVRALTEELHLAETELVELYESAPNLLSRGLTP